MIQCAAQCAVCSVQYCLHWWKETILTAQSAFIYQVLNASSGWLMYVTINVLQHNSLICPFGIHIYEPFLPSVLVWYIDTKRVRYIIGFLPWGMSLECCQFLPPGAQQTAFVALAQLTDKMDPMYIIPKWPATWIFMRLFFNFKPLSCQLMAAILDFSI